jgi:hypothetical protein
VLKRAIERDGCRGKVGSVEVADNAPDKFLDEHSGRREAISREGAEVRQVRWVNGTVYVCDDSAGNIFEEMEKRK